MQKNKKRIAFGMEIDLPEADSGSSRILHENAESFVRQSINLILDCELRPVP
jgi:hypothetical protein